MTSDFERYSYCSIVYVLGGKTTECTVAFSILTALLCFPDTPLASGHATDYLFVGNIVYTVSSAPSSHPKGPTCGLYLPGYARLSTLKWDTPCLYGLSDFLKFRLLIETYLRHTKLLSFFFFFHSTLWLQFVWKLVWRRQLGLKWVVFGIITFSVVDSCMQSLPFNPWGKQ